MYLAKTMELKHFSIQLITDSKIRDQGTWTQWILKMYKNSESIVSSEIK